MGINKRKIGLFLSSSGAVVFSLSLLIGLYNFGVHRLTFIPAGFGLLVALLGFSLSLDFWRSRFSKKSSQYSVMSWAYILLACILILSLNYVVSKKSMRFDMSEQQVNSLSDQSRKILKSLTEDVRITVFLEKSDPRLPLIQNLAQEYEGFSSRISFRYLSPKFDVKEVRQYQFKEGAPAFIAERAWENEDLRKDLRFRVSMKNLNIEEIVTNAILRIQLDKSTQIVIIGGHGELDPLDASNKGMTKAMQLLKNEGYEAVPLNLMAAQRLPDELNLIIIAGVKVPFLAPEKQVLNNYIQKGGHVLLMLEPESKHGLEQILNDFGVMANNDVVLDVSPFAKMYGEKMAVSLEFADHPLTKKFQNTMCLFPGARSLSVQAGKKNVQLTELLKTGEKSWGESNFSALAQGEAEWQLGEVKGPVTLAVAGEKLSTNGQAASRFVIIGDADFISNENLMQGANRNFFMNSVAWLSDIEENITIRPRIRGHNQIILTPMQRDGIEFFVLELLPTMILALGLGLYFSRKEQ